MLAGMPLSQVGTGSTASRSGRRSYERIRLPNWERANGRMTRQLSLNPGFVRGAKPINPKVWLEPGEYSESNCLTPWQLRVLLT